MSFETYFRAASYATIVSAMLALFLAGGLHAGLAIAFAVVVMFAWKLENTKWQLSQGTGLLVVLLSVPLFIIDWQFQKATGEPTGRFGVTALAHLMIFLAAVKLLQVKKDRDWVFLYLISFFEVLLAAGLSFSPVFLGTLTLYLLCGLSTIIAFEIQKAKQSIAPSETRLLVPPDSGIFKKFSRRRGNVEAGRLPWVAVTLLILIFVLALPLFLVAPRSGSAALTRGGVGLTNLIGFSESVTLGEIGNLKRDNAVVMHVRLESTPPIGYLRWRGVALDEFTGRGWKKSNIARRTEKPPNDKGLIALGTTEALDRLTTQTIFLEPIQSSVLFAASRPVAIQGDFPSVLVDTEDSVQSRRPGVNRIMYRALSDITQPEVELLRGDVAPYQAGFERYLQLPALIDSRIEARANAMVVNAHARNRYDIARAIEAQLQTDFGYSLQMVASGPDPLSDFLFNVKTGHCEYFSTAMAVMLRTQGIAARVVNGFLPGEYNDAAGAYAVRQSDAHSWVEVYFPETRSWVTFDPTPTEGRTDPVRTGLAAQLGKYAEALELFWFQYVVGYDKQEQRSLATSLQAELLEFRRIVALTIAEVRQTLSAHGLIIIFASLGVMAGFLLISAAIRVRRFGWKTALRARSKGPLAETSQIAFYERLTALMKQQGRERDPHLTPLEFAGALDFQPALFITRAYNRVRYGGQKLSAAELKQIEQALEELEGKGEVLSAEC